MNSIYQFDSVLHQVTAAESERDLKNIASVPTHTSTKFCCWSAIEVGLLTHLVSTVKMIKDHRKMSRRNVSWQSI